ncbi:superfamily I DNA and RNA helicase [Marinobacterium sp. MBR-111]|jgi:superfamily I DNA and RNA helicase|uniref:DEAD/DEAH box helicase n=1 Tax=Marinobacterium sp. MBR-111 TaxID=3156463 RepID=UPI00339B849A
MIDFVFGKKTNPQAVNGLVDQLKELDLDGTLYIGYPIFDVDDDSLLTDALLVTQEHGVVIFDLTTSSIDDEDRVVEYQDDLYRGLSRKFLSERQLVKRRDLTFDINVVSIRQEHDFDDVEIITLDEVPAYVTDGDGLSDREFKLINGNIQKTSVLKPARKRVKVENEDSLGAAIKNIEKEIANLDRWQKKAAIESPEKPQRIRGLAGCGKTIILSMKAAYLHAIDPTLNIVVTFQSRALYQQLEKLVSRFYFEHLKEDIDPEYLQIMHAWGSTSSVGLYAQICLEIGIFPLSWGDAKRKYGIDNAFEGACAEALKAIENIEVKPIYDYILIDEAQDFPVSFFQLIYRFVKNPKHIVWAYDELQNLGEYSMLPPENLFGVDSNGTPNVTLVNEQGKPQQDIMLPVCYRNPPWTLTLALSLGLGIYRKEGLVRMFPNPDFWDHIGYEVVGGTLDFDTKVSLQRSRERTPEYFYDLIEPENAIKYERFDDQASQAEWVANQIYQNISSDELEIGDILIVFPDAYTLNQ